MEYRNELGQTITDEQLDKMIEEIESGDFSNFEPVGDVIYGAVVPRKTERSTVCVQFPVPMKTRLSQIAEEHSCTMSDLIRAYTYDGMKKEGLQAV